jgi:hypothetical protein
MGELELGPSVLECARRPEGGEEEEESAHRVTIRVLCDTCSTPSFTASDHPLKRC